MKIPLLFLAAFLLPLTALAAEPIVGEWEKSDGQARLKLKLEGGKLNGYLSKIADPKRTHDTNNPDKALRSRKLLGLKIVNGFWKDGNKWVGGTVYDSSKGKTYKGKIWLEGNDKMKMRGFVGVSALGRTAEWKRVR